MKSKRASQERHLALLQQEWSQRRLLTSLARWQIRAAEQQNVREAKVQQVSRVVTERRKILAVEHWLWYARNRRQQHKLRLRLRLLSQQQLQRRLRAHAIRCMRWWGLWTQVRLQERIQRHRTATFTRHWSLTRGLLSLAHAVVCARRRRKAKELVAIAYSRARQHYRLKWLARVVGQWRRWLSQQQCERTAITKSLGHWRNHHLVRAITSLHTHAIAHAQQRARMSMAVRAHAWRQTRRAMARWWAWVREWVAWRQKLRALQRKVRRRALAQCWRNLREAISCARRARARRVLHAWSEQAHTMKCARLTAAVAMLVPYAWERWVLVRVWCGWSNWCASRGRKRWALAMVERRRANAMHLDGLLMLVRGMHCWKEHSKEHYQQEHAEAERRRRRQGGLGGGTGGGSPDGCPLPTGLVPTGIQKAKDRHRPTGTGVL